MATNSVNNCQAKSLEDYANLDFTSAKNSEEIQKSIYDLAKSADVDLTNMEKSKQGDVNQYGIDENEKWKIYEWITTICDAASTIPDKFKSACQAAIDKLKATIINMATKAEYTNIKDNNSGMEVDVNAKKVEFGTPRPLANNNEPDDTDADNSDYYTLQAGIEERLGFDSATYEKYQKMSSVEFDAYMQDKIEKSKDPRNNISDARLNGLAAANKAAQAEERDFLKKMGVDVDK